MDSPFPSGTVEMACRAFAAGSPVIIMDDEDRENEGDLCLPATAITEEYLRFFLKYTTGLICVACSPRRTAELELPLMVSENLDPNRTPFTVTVDLIGTGTGVSLESRCKTIRALADPSKTAKDFTRPGHVAPLRASPKGLYGRQGHTEASVELCKLAKVYPVCVIGEIMNFDGSMARLPECKLIAEKYKIPIISIKEIVKSLPPPAARLPIEGGEFTISTYPPNYVVLSRGLLKGRENVPLRIHSECLTGDVFGSLRCDCRSQLDAALDRIRGAETGILIYVRGHEGRGIGLDNKIRAYGYQDTGLFDTVTSNLELHLPVDDRTYTGIFEILQDLGVKSVDLYTSNPEKVTAVGKFLGCITEDVGEETVENRKYLATKKKIFGGKKVAKKIGLLYTRTWHTESVQKMVEQCREYLKEYTLVERSVSGSYELTIGAQQLLRSGCDGVIALGILLKEETAHFDAVLNAVTYGLTEVQIQEGKPVTFGILACYTADQIKERVFGSKNHVEDWCQATIDLIEN